MSTSSQTMETNKRTSDERGVSGPDERNTKRAKPDSDEGSMNSILTIYKKTENELKRAKDEVVALKKQLVESKKTDGATQTNIEQVLMERCLEIARDNHKTKMDLQKTKGEVEALKEQLVESEKARASLSNETRVLCLEAYNETSKRVDKANGVIRRIRNERDNLRKDYHVVSTRVDELERLYTQAGLRIDELLEQRLKWQEESM